MRKEINNLEKSVSVLIKLVRELRALNNDFLTDAPLTVPLSAEELREQYKKNGGH